MFPSGAQDSEPDEASNLQRVDQSSGDTLSCWLMTVREHTDTHSHLPLCQTVPSSRRFSALPMSVGMRRPVQEFSGAHRNPWPSRCGDPMQIEREAILIGLGWWRVPSGVNDHCCHAANGTSDA